MWSIKKFKFQERDNVFWSCWQVRFQKPPGITDHCQYSWLPSEHDSMTLLLKISHAWATELDRIQLAHLAGSILLNNFYNTRWCYASYWRRKVIIDHLELWYLWTTIMPSLARYCPLVQTWQECHGGVTNHFLIGLKDWSKRQNPYTWHHFGARNLRQDRWYNVKERNYLNNVLSGHRIKPTSNDISLNP